MGLSPRILSDTCCDAFVSAYRGLSRLEMHAILQKPLLSEFPEACSCAVRFVLHPQRSPLRTVGPCIFSLGAQVVDRTQKSLVCV